MTSKKYSSIQFLNHMCFLISEDWNIEGGNVPVILRVPGLHTLVSCPSVLNPCMLTYIRYSHLRNSVSLCLSALCTVFWNKLVLCIHPV